MKNLNNPLIFIVDDDSAFSRLIEMQIKMNIQADVKVFNSGDDCVKNLHLKPTIIILDYNFGNHKLKFQNGIQILDEIKKISPKTKIIMFSGEMHDYIERFYDPRFITNVDRYLIKGMSNDEELIEAVHQFL